MSNDNSKENTVGEVYLHVGNSGVKVSVVNGEHGPTIRIASSSFGNLNFEHEVFVTKEGLAELGTLFEASSKLNFNPPYVHAAK